MSRWPHEFAKEICFCGNSIPSGSSFCSRECAHEDALQSLFAGKSHYRTVTQDQGARDAKNFSGSQRKRRPLGKTFTKTGVSFAACDPTSSGEPTARRVEEAMNAVPRKAAPRDDNRPLDSPKRPPRDAHFATSDNADVGSNKRSRKSFLSAAVSRRKQAVGCDVSNKDLLPTSMSPPKSEAQAHLEASIRTGVRRSLSTEFCSEREQAIVSIQDAFFRGDEFGSLAMSSVEIRPVDVAADQQHSVRRKSLRRSASFGGWDRSADELSDRDFARRVLYVMRLQDDEEWDPRSLFAEENTDLDG